MSDVEYPAMRREVMRALAAFSDPEYQERVWVQRNYPDPNFYDDLTQNVHVLYDDCQVLPDPVSRLRWVLLDGDELKRLRALDGVLGPMIDELGEAPDATYLQDSRWPSVMSTASRALSAMVLAGGF